MDLRQHLPFLALLLFLPLPAPCIASPAPACQGTFQNRTPTDAELKNILETHRAWVLLYFPQDRPHVEGAARDYAGRADLCGAKLWRKDLSDSNLSRAQLSNSDLTGVHLWDSNLSHTQLSHATLAWADLWDANLSEANLIHADLTGAMLWDANLSGRYWHTPTSQGRICPTLI